MVKMKKVNIRKYSLRASFTRYKKHAAPIFIFLVIAVALYSGWLIGLQQGGVPAFEEGLMDIACLDYYLNHICQYHYLPTLFDSRTYSQPMDLSYYTRTPVLVFPLLLSPLLGQCAFNCSVATFILCNFLSMLITYYLVYRHTRNIWASFLSAILYILSNSLLISGIAHGHLRYAAIIFLIPLMFLATDLVFADEKRPLFIGAIATVLLYLWFLGVNSTIGTICLVCCITVWMGIYACKKRLPRLAVLTSIFVICATSYYVVFILSYAKFFPSAQVTLNELITNETPNLLQALALNIAQANRTNPAVMSIGVLYAYTLIQFLPLPLSILAIFNNRRHIVPFFIGVLLMLFSTPLSVALYMLMPMPFRAPGRTFLPTATFIFAFLAGIGFSWLYHHLPKNIHIPKLKNKTPQIFSLGLICLILAGSMPVFMYTAKSWNIPSDIEQAYRSIPKGSRVLMIPIYGTVSFGYSLSSPEQAYYREDASVGWTLVHLHEYMASKYQLKCADGGTSWEIPFMTKWWLEMINEKMATWNDTIGAINTLSLAPDLQYLVVYKKITPLYVLEQLDKSNQLEKTFNSETMAVYKRTNSIEQPIMESNKAFLLYCGSYRYSLPSITMLTSGQTPIIMGQTPWELFDLENAKNMENLIFTTQNTFIDDIVTEYAIVNTKNKVFINLEDTISATETSWIRSGFWQPSLGKYTIATITPEKLYNVSFKVDAEDTYDIYIRSPCNGPWRGKLQTYLNHKYIGTIIFPQDSYGFKWFNIGTFNLTRGEHTLGLKNTESQWIDIDAIAIVKHDEIKQNIEAHKKEIAQLISKKDYLGIYEAETSYISLNKASVTDDWNTNWTTYPSGGWVRGQTVKIAAQGYMEIKIEAPISGEYCIAVKQKGKSNMRLYDQEIFPYQIQTSDNFNYVYYQVYLTEGEHTIKFTATQEPVWIDCIYLSNKPLPSLLSNENPNISISVKNDGDYIINSSASQPRYTLLMKSYFPLWTTTSSSGKTQQAYLANGFLTCFYISEKKYEIRFGE